MKALTQIITVVTTITMVISGASTVAASGEEELAQLQKTLAEADQVAATVSELAALDAKVQAELAVQQALAQAKRGAEQILLVLTSQTRPEDLATIIEDLKIMSRILDNKLGRAQPRSFTLNVSKLDNLLRSFTRADPMQTRTHAGAMQTQAMYVQSYAAIFFANVDFPLSPPPQVEVKKVQEGADPIWEQTKRQIIAPEQDLQPDVAAKQYDAEKVEQLKTTLIKALKHAANIRNLKPDESVILVVAGTQPPILTIRAKKADIDAYSTVKMTDDQFRQRVAILTSHASLGPGQSEKVSWPRLTEPPPLR